MIDDVREIIRLLRKHGARKEAAQLSRTLELHGKDAPGLAAALGSLELWGGSGSIADQFLVPQRGEPVSAGADRVAFYQAMVRLAGHLERAGKASPRALAWANAFRHWLGDSTDGSPAQLPPAPR